MATGAALPVLAFLFLHFVASLVPFARGGVRPFLYGLLHAAACGANRRLNREARTPGALFLRGACVTVLFALLALVLGGAVQSVRAAPYGWMVHIVFLACACTAMAPLHLVQKTARALGAKDEGAARALLRPHAGDDPDTADSFTLARRAAALGADSLLVFFTGPLFWYAVLGAQGAAIFVAFSAMRACFGDGHFGAACRPPDEVLKFIPALLSGTGIALAAVFVGRAHPVGALDSMLERKMKDGADLRPRAAMAGALAVTLGGPPQGWVGPKGSSAKVMPEDLDRCAMILFVFFLCTMAAVSALALGVKYIRI